MIWTSQTYSYTALKKLKNNIVTYIKNKAFDEKVNETQRVLPIKWSFEKPLDNVGELHDYCKINVTATSNLSQIAFINE